MNDEPLLKQTLRTTALFLVPVAAFLAILSAVALFAIPSATPKDKEKDKVVNVIGSSSKTTAAKPQAKP
jgi:hypothetical protein